MEPMLAIDWGTTNRRVFRVEGGAVVATERDDHGVLAMAGRDWPAELAGIRARFGDLPVLIAGMAGSNRGWREVPYVPCPATLDALVAGLLWVEPGRTAIVPGVMQPDPADIMRGEEVQLLGAVLSGAAPQDATLCQPGTHCKWVRMTGGAIAGFTTAMTGEVFALLRRHSLLATQIEGEAAVGGAFRDGVRAAAAGDLLANLFGVRAGAVLGSRTADLASYASGLVIGADVAARRPGAVHILADPGLGGLYAAAVEALGGRADVIESHAAFLAGIVAIWERCR